ncbi:MAG: gamma-glutamyltransferase family protein [Actinobacteria bacterium]|nr:gamma-glutamyltransferase family protein [Actinomycetota bacterium]
MFTTRPELTGTFGMVASTHWLASGVGMAVLEDGGNAFDAAVAAGLVLQVVEPHLNGPGGEVPILYHDVARDEVRVVSGQGPVPAAANIAAFRALGLDLIPGTGLLAACVPGAFDAWMLLLGRCGTMPLRAVMRYAIDYAAGGYPLVHRIVETIAAVSDTLRTDWPTSAAVYLPDGRPPASGSLFSNPALAATYRRILAEAEAATHDRDGQIQAARDAFYRGFVAEAIDGWLSDTAVRDSSGRRHRGLLTADDMAAYAARVEPPLTLDHGAYRVCKAGPWTQGPVFLQQLALLAGFDLLAMGHNSSEYIHTVIECAKLAYADREAWYGDPDVVDVPLSDLLDPGYANGRRGLVGNDASHALHPGRPGGRVPRLAPQATAGTVRAVGIGEPTVPSTRPPAAPVDGDTCHIDVVDRFGNMVAATPSGGWLQSSPVVGELGFCLGTRAQMCWLAEGLPASLRPGARPRTTLTPTLALRDGEPYLAFGTPGGDQQDQWSLQLFLAHTVFGRNLQEAIDAPAFHTTHFPSSFYPRHANSGQIHVEGRHAPEVIADLRNRGHRVEVTGDWSLGRLSAVSRSGRTLRAAANPRGMQGYAVGR